MIYTDPTAIDFKKYKRFFVFGCSFTNYRWPTWADIVAQEMPKAFYVNAGASGAGNQYISAQISQHIRMFNIGANDLVAVMWSGIYREDRYKDGNWLTPGNIYTQNTYDEHYINSWVDRRGFVIRDLATMDHVMSRFSTAEFDSFSMMGIPLDKQNSYSGVTADAKDRILDLIAVYSDLQKQMLPDLMTTQFPEGWTNSYTYTDRNGEQYTDYHPSPNQYAEYLKQIGFKLSKKTLTWCEQQDNHFSSLDHIDNFGWENPPEQLF